MTAKPIAVVYLPDNLDVGGMKPGWDICTELMGQFKKDMPDYYWLVLFDCSVERIELKVFYEKDFSPTTYEELKSLITNAIEQTKNKKP